MKGIIYGQGQHLAKNMHSSTPLPGNQTLINKYQASRGVVVSVPRNGSGWQCSTKQLYTT